MGQVLMADTITQKGRDSLDNGEFDDDPCAALIMEVLSRAVTMDKDNCLQLCQELVDTFGSYELAVTALRDGKVNIEFVRRH
jgi:hypothetical protein